MNEKCKVLVLGCNGMLGHMVTLYLQEQGFDVTGFARSNSNFVTTIVADAFNTDLLRIIIPQYDYVVNCIGVLNNDAETNKSNAIFLNSYLPHFLCDVSKGSKTKIIQISTDCVFSGIDGNYTVDHFKDGRTFYDRTKALGEIIDDKNLTLRQSIVGPDINENGIGLFNWFMKQSNSVQGYTESIWTGQTTLQLAKTIEYCINTNINGIYNAVPEISICKYDLLQLFNKYFRNNQITIIPTKNSRVDKSLVASKFDNYIVPNYETMIKEMKDWILSHNEVYKRYDVQ